jgi:hypothetical protein
MVVPSNACQVATLATARELEETSIMARIFIAADFMLLTMD